MSISSSQKVSMTDREKVLPPQPRQSDLRRQCLFPTWAGHPALRGLASSFPEWVFLVLMKEHLLPPECLQSQLRSYQLKQQLQQTLLPCMGPTLGGSIPPTQAAKTTIKQLTRCKDVPRSSGEMLLRSDLSNLPCSCYLVDKGALKAFLALQG